jgi:hypothetical protein
VDGCGNGRAVAIWAAINLNIRRFLKQRLRRADGAYPVESVMTRE